MVCIAPFKGWRYNQEVIKDLSQVVAPPYDVISPEAQERYYQLHENNIIRLILSKQFTTDTEADNRYTRSSATFKDWIANKVLIEDAEPALYFLKESYFHQGQSITRRGFIGLMKLEDIGSGQVQPHEKTHSQPKVDRLNLMRACHANLCQVFGLYSDKQGLITQALEQELSNEPLIDIIDEEGIKRSLWGVKEPETLETITKLMQDKVIIIADGHHRYETALNFAKEMAAKNPSHTGQEPYHWLMIYLTNMDDKDTIIFPTHRLVKNVFLSSDLIKEISRYFEIEEMTSLEAMLGLMKQQAETKHIFGLHLDQGYYCLSLKDKEIMNKLVTDKSSAWKELDVSILQVLLINHLLQVKDIEASLSYTKDEGEAVRLVETGQYQLALFLNPTPIKQLQAITAEGELMPQKSTYFYPKLLSGMVINKIRIRS